MTEGPASVIYEKIQGNSLQHYQKYNLIQLYKSFSHFMPLVSLSLIKPEVFRCFQKVWQEANDTKWVKQLRWASSDHTWQFTSNPCSASDLISSASPWKQAFTIAGYKKQIKLGKSFENLNVLAFSGRNSITTQENTQE